MNKYRATVGKFLLLALCIVAAAGMRGGVRLGAQLLQDDYTKLLECRFYPELFAVRPVAGLGQSRIQQVAEAYHRTVSEVVAAHAADNATVVCTNEPYREPSIALRSLAEIMPPWAYGATLTEDDLPAVLLTYLSAFECALMDLEGNTTEEAARFAADDGIGAEQNNAQNNDPTVSELGRESRARTEEVDREMRVARDALHRTLRYLGARERLDPLKRNLLCLERASLDIRNNVALMAEAAQCADGIGGRSALRTLAP